jgi:hypothetical protein
MSRPFGYLMATSNPSTARIFPSTFFRRGMASTPSSILAAPGGGMQLRGVDGWLESLEARHLRELTFPEVRRALQALSALYIAGARQAAWGRGAGGSRQARAFALFYGPMHF